LCRDTANNVCIGTTITKSKFTVQGTAKINNGTAISRAEMMSAGNLTIGSTDFKNCNDFYSGGNWTGTNTGGLMMECAEKTEIVIHDGGNCLASFMQYVGGGTNQYNIGRGEQCHKQFFQVILILF
jgi:hypothetical protein